VQPFPRIERIGKAEQIPLIGATAVVEDQKALWGLIGRSFRLDERLHREPI